MTIVEDRNETYGDPVVNMTRTAKMVDAMLQGAKIEAHHIPMIQICVKLSRAMTSPKKADHWDDIAGYAEMGKACNT